MNIPVNVALTNGFLEQLKSPKYAPSAKALTGIEKEKKVKSLLITSDKIVLNKRYTCIIYEKRGGFSYYNLVLNGFYGFRNIN